LFVAAKEGVEVICDEPPVGCPMMSALVITLAVAAFVVAIGMAARCARDQSGSVFFMSGTMPTDPSSLVPATAFERCARQQARMMGECVHSYSWYS
jgi:hypothetical protein